MSPSLVFGLSWGLWLTSWLAASWWASPPVKRASETQSLRFNLPIIFGVALLPPATSHHLHAFPLWDVRRAGAYALAVLTIPCFLFAWWARVQLGALWSGAITRKAVHRIVDTGPYALVRHPMYTGMIGATIVSAMAEATLPAIGGALLIIFGLWLKARTEEAFLAEELGASAYAAYRRKVPMLIPFAQRH